jgi:cyclic beta-1,2-glucan synthetase
MHYTDLLNPLLRVTDRAAAERYLGEPYVMPGDVYAVGDTAGQAGWTWYTGSAGWLYRVMLERQLGLRSEAGRLVIAPCLPHAWDGYEIELAVGRARYRIEVHEPGAIARHGAAYRLDGKAVEAVELSDDGHTHAVVVTRLQGPSH